VLPNQIKKHQSRTGRQAFGLTDEQGRERVVERRVEYRVGFVQIFPEALDELMSKVVLNRFAFRVMVKLLRLMEVGQGGLLGVSQSALAKDLGVKQPQVARAFKELKVAGVLLDHEGHTIFNMALFYKGSPKDMTGRYAEALDKSVEALDRAGVPGAHPVKKG
jgi:hypothetical protein